ncbi:DUF1801 domain-containing protein [Pyruvatibacter mobilis]|uniref:DUF1801 domain-containing protein n=1 Tax=Pyruvatibacter mobilis TaxID=1712261 RepID=A0A845QFS7_9HYPH|nr:DUF1801 domain-containing protein [Pyruvatibacter mobilis]NBG96936.1 DUF1801 domain-containing protein [Pyruvatibacter mobilis]QJD74686.1 DUF1801 domain-containing protein [Pyruvatibacter mobilis]GGD09306.1 hypothetical protein GCM10011587_11470 [Pyruvatibacter mobilis]
MAENKTVPTRASVNAFLDGVAPARRQADARVALEIYRRVTGLEPVMWGPSIIGFGERRYTTDAGRAGRVPAACFSPRKANMTFYVRDSFPEAETLYARLGKHRRSVACLYINKLDDVDLAVLEEIIARQYAADIA